MPLYTEVIPSLTVTDETVMDAAALNQLGTPTVHITGTLDGSSSLSVGAGTVTNAMLENMPANTVKGRDESTGVPVNLTMHSSMDIDSGALKVKDGGITTTQLASTATVVAGAIADVNIAQGTIGPNKLKAQAALTLLGNGGDTASAAPEAILIGSGLTVTNADEKATTTRARDGSNVATIGCTGHGYSVSDKVNVTGMTDTSFNAYGATILSVATDSFTYANVGSTVSSGSDTGGKVRRIQLAAGTPTSTISSVGFFKAFGVLNGGVSSGGVNLNTLSSITWTGTSSPTTYTTSAAHGLVAGEAIYVATTTSGGGGGTNPGIWYVNSAPTSTTFTLLRSGASNSGTITLGPFVRTGYYNIHGTTAVTRNGAGDYTIPFATAIYSSTDYDGCLCSQVTTGQAVLGNTSQNGNIYGIADTWLTNSSLRIQCGSSSGTPADLHAISFSVFGNTP